MSQFNWDDLRFFLAVARAGRLTVAARRLGADHATVSRRIASLEAALKATLFERRPQGYALTPHGERLVATAEAIESAALAASSDIGGADLALSGSVRIGAPDGFGSLFLAPRTARLVARYPGLELQLVAMPRLLSLSKREADIAVALAPPKEGRVVARRLTDYRLGLFASRDYLAASPPIRTPDDLFAHPLVGYIDDLIYMPELDYLDEVAKGLRPRLQSSSLVAQMEATLAGAGVCVLPHFMAAGRPGLAPVLPREVSLTRTFWLIVHAELRDVARVRAVADFVLREVRQARGLLMGEAREPAPAAP
ncbi:LysR family transcriptional regulator [Alsobacter sp. SYSU M60028]|uniref:LysR family transcriptional regulator n=1 Tax=Alsobacter ponti TaxID=2962936 RepID=A0ABT1LBE2_9HYPH|nr:LysR family transcriptional regulator [Alsobacter ponti]MCP8938802.1 LysR family transcriptional regulator [Alsobacter ponti]